MRFRTKIILTIMLVSLIPFLTAMAISIFRSMNYSQDTTYKLAEDLTRYTSDEFSRFFQARKDVVSTYANIPLVETMDWNIIEPYFLKEKKRSNLQFEKILLGTPEGHFYNTSGGNPFFDGKQTTDNKNENAKLKTITKRDYWKIAFTENKSNKDVVYVSNPMISKSTGAKQIMVSSSIKRNDKIVGIVAGSITWNLIDKQIERIKKELSDNLGKDSKFCIISHTGNYVYHWEKDKNVHLEKDKSGKAKVVITNVKSDKGPLQKHAEEILKNEIGFFPYKDKNGISQLAFHGPIKSSGFKLLITVPESFLFSYSESLLIFFGILTLISIIAIVIAGILLAQNLARPIRQAALVAKEVANGNLEQEIEVKGKGETALLLESLKELIESSRNMSNIAKEIAEGKLNVEVKQRSDKDILGKSFNDMIKTWKKVLDDMDKLYKLQTEGDYEYFIDENEYEGSYQQMVKGVNEAIKIHVNNILMILNIVSEYAEGKFEAKLKPLPGKQIIANELMDKLRINLLSIVEEIRSVITNALEGNLEYRGIASKYEGAFQDILDGINETLDAVLEPVIKASAILQKMADGDMTETLIGQYKGDHALLQTSINKTLEGINSILYQVKIAVDQVSNGSKQVSQASQSLSQGATEQASSIEEITSSLTEINSQTKQNLDKIINANEITQKSVELGKEGNSQLEELVRSVQAINESSDKIKKITKMIDDISFQINLLALNASVEAARAGKYGKGFAVVAEEVRNLAVKSAESVKETSSMVDEATRNINIVNQLVEKTTEHFKQITDGAQKSSTFLDNIVVATKEQSLAIDEIDNALEQVGKVTQSNTANAEESASAAEELSSQSVQLQNMVMKFNVSEDLISKEHFEFVSKSDEENKKQEETKKDENNKETGINVVNPSDEISLDDDDFGNF